MAVKSQPRLRTFKAKGVIRPYRIVKWGVAPGEMLEADLNEKGMGIYQGESNLADGDFGEIAIQGGGGLLEISETVVAGKYLTPTADGIGEIVDLAGEFYNAIADEPGVAGDIIGVEIVGATESVSTDV